MLRQLRDFNGFANPNSALAIPGYLLAIRPVVGQHFPQSVTEVFIHCTANGDRCLWPKESVELRPVQGQFWQYFLRVPYEINTLGASITATTTSSKRNGRTSINTTWK